MSVPVPITAVESLELERLARRPMVRRRTILVVVAMALVSGLAAVPLPVRAAYNELLAEVVDLESSVGAIRTDEQGLRDWLERLGEQPEDLHSRAERWLGETDTMELRNRLVAVARMSGLTLSTVAMERGHSPLTGGRVKEQAAMVLGSSLDDDDFGDEFGDDELEDELGDEFGDEFGDEPAPARPEAGPPPLTATRFTLSGTGPASGVLLFSGLLRELPHPLRLLMLEIDPADQGCRFLLVADRLACPLNAGPPARKA